jgi:hypothetical protein
MGEGYTTTKPSTQKCSNCGRYCCIGYIKDCLCVSHGGGTGCYPEWKLKIEREEERKKQEEQRERDEVYRRSQDERRRQEQIQKRAWLQEYDQKITLYQTRFSCHIAFCGTPVIPGERGENPAYMNWDRAPYGFAICYKCQQLTCPSHLFKGICMNCA